MKIVYASRAFLAFSCIALLPRVQAVSPPPDGGYPSGNNYHGAEEQALGAPAVGRRGLRWFGEFFDVPRNSGLKGGHDYSSTEGGCE